MSFDGIKWYKRTALLYAVGTWTLVGSCIYYTFCKSDARVVIRKKKDEDENTAPNVRKYESSLMSVKTTYREDFVPYSARFLELFRPRAEDSSGSQNDDK